MPRHESELFYFAGQLAPLLAHGRVHFDDARLLIEIMVSGQGLRYPCGLQARLCWHMRDAAGALTLAEAKAERRIRGAIRPLFQRGASKAEIEEAAGSTAAPLEWPDIYPILRDELIRERKRPR